jgi:hypothetical protein
MLSKSRSINDTSRVVRMTIIGEATTWSITYTHHSDDYRDVIYDCSIFITQATGGIGTSVSLQGGFC